jgi:hypothetical protein
VGKPFVFVTKNFTLVARQIATIYINRWMIEPLFKQIKQNFQLTYFGGEPEYHQDLGLSCIDCSVVDVCYQEKTATKESFANMITLICLHLMIYVGVQEFMKNTYSE